MKSLIIVLAFLSLTGLTARADEACFIQGTYSLQVQKFNPPMYPLSVTGFINSGINTTYINWQAMFTNYVSGGAQYSIAGSYKGEWLKLILIVNNMNTVELMGDIHGQSILWTGINYWITGTQQCIP